MKKLVQILIFTLFISNVYSQETPLNKIDEMLINIDKSSLTTDVLYERVFPFAKLAIFNDRINISNVKHFEQALSELYKASNKQKFTSYKQLRTHYSSVDANNIVDIGIINASFNQLNYIEEDLQKSALKVVNGKFERITTDKQLFIPKEVLVISPLKQYLVGNAITYHFDAAFLIQDSSKTIHNIVANFGTSTNYTIYNNGSFTNQNLTINYIKTGYKTLTFTVIYNDNSKQITQAKVHIKRTSLNQPAARWSSASAPNPTDFDFKGYDESTAINGEIEYRIWYTNGSKGTNLSNIQKPIVIIDGFDPLDKRKIIDVDSNKPADEHTSIAELMVYPDPNIPNRTINIIEKFNLDGYDVIIVNQPFYTRNGVRIDGGADYIECNGLTHASFYQEINRNLTVNGSAEKLVIMGPSMGGQISRYALAYMEKKELETGLSSWNHNTRLWVSIDSPHLGANIPIGVQSFLNQVKDDNPSAKDFVEKELGSAAAKQQIIEQFKGWNGTQLKTDYLDGRTVSQGYSQDKGHPFFVNFYNNLYSNGLPNSKGYPQNLKKIALTNGSLTGSKSYLDNNSYANNSQITTNIKAFQYFLRWPFRWSVHIGSLETYAMPAYGNNHKVSRFKKGFDDKSKYITNNNSRGNMDNISGGFFAVYDEITEGLDGSDPLSYPAGTFQSFSNYFSTLLAFLSDSFGGARMSVRANEHVSSFISTPSSLGIINPDFNWNQNLNRNLVCTGETPFDSYYGEKENTSHVSFSEDSFNWLKKWIDENDGLEPDPTVYLTNPYLQVPSNISGVSKLCEGQTTVYSIDNCTTSSVSWATSSNLQILSSTIQQATVKSINSDAPIGWVRVTLPNGNYKSKKILGKPSISYKVNGFKNPTVTTYGVGMPLNQQGITNTQWIKTGGTGQIISNPFQTYAIGPTGGGLGLYNSWYVSGLLKVTNSCGTTTKNFYISPSGVILQKFQWRKIAKNQYKLVSSSSEEQLKENYVPLKAELYNILGIKIKVSIENNTINLCNQPKGSLMILKAIKDGEVISKKILID